jgi:hypothetical protein
MRVPSDALLALKYSATVDINELIHHILCEKPSRLHH